MLKCNVCGNVVEQHVNGGGQLVCCDKEMMPLKELSGDEGNEKHKPVIEESENGIVVKVGSVPHPMTEEHSIMFVQVEYDGKTYTQHLQSTEEPKAEFAIPYSDDLKAREYCNLHGLWSNK